MNILKRGEKKMVSLELCLNYIRKWLKFKGVGRLFEGFHINFKKKLDPVWMANTVRCTGPVIAIHTGSSFERKFLDIKFPWKCKSLQPLFNF